MKKLVTMATAFGLLLIAAQSLACDGEGKGKGPGKDTKSIAAQS